MHGTPGKAAQRVKARATHAQNTWMALCSRGKMLKLFVSLKLSTWELHLWICSLGTLAWELKLESFSLGALAWELSSLAWEL